MKSDDIHGNPNKVILVNILTGEITKIENIQTDDSDQEKKSRVKTTTLPPDVNFANKVRFLWYPMKFQIWLSEN